MARLQDVAAAVGAAVGARAGAAVAGPAPGFIRFRSRTDPAVSTTWELDGPVVPAGYATVAVTAVPGGVAFTGDGGRDPLSLRIPLRLDRALQDRSVERDIAMLERIMGVRRGRPNARPLRVLVEAVGVRHAYERRPELRWRLSDPEWSGDDGDVLFQRGSTGRQVRAVVAVTATAVNRPDPDDVDDLEDSTRRYVAVKAGGRDTLREIGKASHVKWSRLIALNPSVPRDPDRKLKAGTRIRVR